MQAYLHLLTAESDKGKTDYPMLSGQGLALSRCQHSVFYGRQTINIEN